MAKFFLYPFGVSGDRTTIPDPSQPSGSVSYQTGFTSDYQKDLLTDPDAKAIPRDQSNQLYYDITNAIKQYQTHGNPDWITSVDNGGSPYPYDIYSIVRYNDGVAGMKLYMSLADNNTATPSTGGVTDPSWLVISDPSVPVGTMIDYAGTSLPSGYLNCDGSAVSRTTYALLFAAIGTTWGTGDGSTTFNLPDFRRRTSIGSGGSGTGVIGNAVGNTGGTEAYAIAGSDLPAHAHPTPTGGDFVVNGISGSISLATGGATTGQVSQTGNNSTPNNPISLMQPSAVVMKCIKYV